MRETDKTIEAMKQALEALEGCTTWHLTREQYDRNVTTIVALRAALYPAQNTRNPLTQENVEFLVTKHSSFQKHYVGNEVFANWECDGAALVRSVERAHGIGGSND